MESSKPKTKLQGPCHSKLDSQKQETLLEKKRKKTTVVLVSSAKNGANLEGSKRSSVVTCIKINQLEL